MSADPEFEQLVNHYYRDLYRFGFSLTGSEADACDLTQETFYVWARKGHQLRNPENVKTWLFTTLHREFLKICRRRKRFPHETINEAAEDLPHVPAACVERLDAQTLCSAGALLCGRLVLQGDRGRAGSSARHRAITNRSREGSTVEASDRNAAYNGGK